MKAYCFPVCKVCRDADHCPKVPVQQSWKPDRLTGKLLKCGHICDILPIVHGIVDSKGHCIANEVMCDTCHKWQPIRWKDGLPEVDEPSQANQLVIPF